MLGCVEEFRSDLCVVKCVEFTKFELNMRIFENFREKELRFWFNHTHEKMFGICLNFELNLHVLDCVEEFRSDLLRLC